MKFDRLNWAILNRKKFIRYKERAKSVEGYYPSLKKAMTCLLELKCEKDLLDKVVTCGFFTKLDKLVDEYILCLKVIPQSSLVTLDLDKFEHLFLDEILQV